MRPVWLEHPLFFRGRLRTLYRLGWPVSRDKQRFRDHIDDLREQNLEALAKQRATEAEVKRHAEERELAPEIPVETAVEPADRD